MNDPTRHMFLRHSWKSEVQASFAPYCISEPMLYQLGLSDSENVREMVEVPRD